MEGVQVENPMFATMPCKVARDRPVRFRDWGMLEASSGTSDHCRVGTNGLWRFSA